MKYAIIGPKKAINRIADKAIVEVPEGATAVELTDEQAVAAETLRTAKQVPMLIGVDVVSLTSLLEAGKQFDGTTWINPPPRPKPVPQSVTPLQMRLALNQSGLRPMVDAAVEAADQTVKDSWDYTLEIRRDNALLGGMAAQLGLTSEQVDDLFRLAATF